MYYRKKNEDKISVFTEKTLAEKLTGRFDMTEPPSKKQVNRFYLSILLGALLMFCGFCSAHACEAAIANVERGNGAGSDWTCGNCGSSNKQWEMCCSGCGQWR